MSRVIELLNVDADEAGGYMVCRLHQDQESVVFRWGLEPFTFEAIRNEFQFLKAGDPRARFRLSLASAKNGQCAIQGVSGMHTRTRYFSCSDEFVANAEWIRGLKDTSSLPEAVIERNEVHSRSLKTDHAIDARFGALWRSKPNWLYRAFALPILCGFGLLVINNMILSASHESTRATDAPPPYVEIMPPLHVMEVVSQEPGPLSESVLQARTTITESEPTYEPDTTVEPETNSIGTVATESCDLSSARQEDEVQVIYGIDPGEVSLTFDDGPSRYTQQIVDILDTYDVKATFFFVGNRVEKWPDQVSQAAKNGHVVGSHSMSHADMTNLTDDQQRVEIAKSAELLQELVGHKIALFRPPYGKWDSRTKTVMKDESLVFAMWNRDPKDWDVKSPEELVARVVSDNPSGGVFVLHESDVTVRALPAILDGLMDKGLQVVPLGDTQPGLC